MFDYRRVYVYIYTVFIAELFFLPELLFCPLRLNSALRLFWHYIYSYIISIYSVCIYIT